MPIFNRHHQIPKSKGGADSGINIKRTEINEHLSLHRYFGNKTPAEQLLQVIEKNDKVWTEEFKAKLLLLLKSFNRGKCYKTEAIKKGRKQQLIAKEDI